MLFLIQLLSSDEVRTVRHPVLRHHKPYDSCFFAEDDDTTTFHLGLYHNNTRLAGVVTFILTDPSLTNNIAQYQLRGMAVLPEFQHKGYGSALIEHGVTHAKKLGATAIWCKARAVAKSFYSKHGFVVKGNPFDIPNIGTHFRMHKKL